MNKLKIFLTVSQPEVRALRMFLKRFFTISASMCVNKLESSSVLVKMQPEEFIWGMDRGLFEQVQDTFFP